MLKLAVTLIQAVLFIAHFLKTMADRQAAEDRVAYDLRKFSNELKKRSDLARKSVTDDGLRDDPNNRDNHDVK